MKGLTPILLLSVAANLALGALVLSRRPPPNGASDSASPAATVTPDKVPASSDAPTPASRESGDATGPQPRAADIAYVARLRAAGLPADLIRDLVYQRIAARYNDRRRAMVPEDPDQYWRSFSQTGLQAASPETRAKLRELYKEMEAEVRAVLGGGPDSLGYAERRMRDQVGGAIPTDKLSQLDAIQRDYSEMAANVLAKGRGLVLKADREQLRLLERERRKDLETVLTPEEIREYDLRASPTANSLRNRLANFEPTEEEFRAIAGLQLAIDQQFGTSNLSREEQDAKRAAEKNLPGQIQAALTPERYADYLVTTDGMYGETSSFVRSNDLNPAVAKEIVALKQGAWKRVDEIEQHQLPADQRTAALQALEREVEQQLTATLGTEVYAGYKRTLPTWMNRLRVNPPRR
ncbi:MAG TPA: hypothetical protein VG734_00085 [Lacunisphaera sp.]|nr:hypothetical protein [Lacunisphaera sp.]